MRSSFGRQRMMETLQARITELQPGRCVLEMPYVEAFGQQHGYLHAGATASLADSACGYAAYTLAPPGHTVLTVEYKVNLLAPGRGDRFVADAHVVKAGRTLSVSTASVTGFLGDDELAVAQMQATLIVAAGDET